MSSPTPTPSLAALHRLAQQLRAARHTPDGVEHTPPSDAERVAVAVGECLADLGRRVEVVERRGRNMEGGDDGE